MRVLQDLYQTAKTRKRLENVAQQHFEYMYPLFQKDIRVSLMGVEATSNLLYFSLFDKAMSVLPIQEKGFYLQENQGWEFGFVRAWRNEGTVIN